MIKDKIKALITITGHTQAEIADKRVLVDNSLI